MCFLHIRKSVSDLSFCVVCHRGTLHARGVPPHYYYVVKASKTRGVSHLLILLSFLSAIFLIAHTRDRIPERHDSAEVVTFLCALSPRPYVWARRRNCAEIYRLSLVLSPAANPPGSSTRPRRAFMCALHLDKRNSRGGGLLCPPRFSSPKMGRLYLSLQNVRTNLSVQSVITRSIAPGKTFLRFFPSFSPPGNHRKKCVQIRNRAYTFKPEFRDYHCRRLNVYLPPFRRHPLRTTMGALHTLLSSHSSSLWCDDSKNQACPPCSVRTPA